MHGWVVGRPESMGQWPDLLIIIIISSLWPLSSPLHTIILIHSFIVITIIIIINISTISMIITITMSQKQSIAISLICFELQLGAIGICSSANLINDHPKTVSLCLMGGVDWWLWWVAPLIAGSSPALRATNLHTRRRTYQCFYFVPYIDHHRERDFFIFNPWSVSREKW